MVYRVGYPVWGNALQERLRSTGQAVTERNRIFRHVENITHMKHNQKKPEEECDKSGI